MRSSTWFVNDTDITIRIRHDRGLYTLRPKRIFQINWYYDNQQDRSLSQLHLEGVELDRNISIDDVYNNKWIVIFGDASDACYSFRTFQSLSSEDMDQVASLPLWILELRTTVFENNTDREIQIDYNGDVYTLNPKSTDIVRWFTYDRHETLLPEITVGGIESDRSISPTDLYDNRCITIFRGVGNACSFQTLSWTQLRERVVDTTSEVKKILRRMEEMVKIKMVKIWCNQCKLLLDNYRVRVNIILQVFDGLPKARCLISRSLVKFMCSKLLCCMLEGEALLLSCSGNNNYTKAAFALSSPPPYVPTFSRFALVLRELGWTLDLTCRLQKHFHGEGFLRADWEWSEKRCGLVNKIQGNSTMNFGVMEEESLEADGRHETNDRKAFETFLKSKKRNRFLIRNEFREKLEAIWRKRLLPPSNTAGPDSVPDCFWIDNPDFKYVDHLGVGSFKAVSKSKWLGEMVAVAIVTDISRRQFVAEAGLLARVQHPNVVELMGCAYKDEDTNNAKGFLVTELMEQDLELLIRQQQGRSPGCTTTMEGSPFHLPVAVDMALQIVEAMIHLKECGVMHRDLKPSNCLASAKYQKPSSPLYKDVPIYYTIKLTDFGTSKMRGQDSYFHTKRLGTASYMAPELHGKAEEDCPYTWSADVYSLGMTYYKIFTGRDPFESKRLKDISAIICEGNRPLIPSGCSKRLTRLIEKCWAQNPADRPTFEDIRKDLWQLKLHSSADILLL